MKTYNIFFVFCVLLIFSCSKSDDDSLPDNSDGKNVATDYIIVMQDSSILSTQLLSANADEITLNPTESSLVEKSIPQLSYSQGANFLQYHQTNACGGMLTQHNFNTDKSTEISVFEDLDACELTATALIQSNDAIFISYVLTNTNPDTYMVRVIDTSTDDFSFVDVSIDKKPVDFAIASNRLFVLTLDEVITDENSLSVMDLRTNSLIHEMELGYDARRIFSSSNDDIIIGYDELHSVMNSNTLDVFYTQYEDDGTAPKFAFSNSRNFDNNGKLYYPADPGSNSTYPLVASSYDFENKLVVLYAFDQLLSEEERNFEYKIKTTSAVNFDAENSLVLIGYEKIEGTKKGGLLRIKLNTSNEVTNIDNIDLDGIPFEIFVQ